MKLKLVFNGVILAAAAITIAASAASAKDGYSTEELRQMALDYYESVSPSHYRPPICDVQINRDDSVTLHLYSVEQQGTEYEHTATSDWYFVDPYTGKGTNLLNEEVDLSLFAPAGSIEEAVTYNVTDTISMKPADAAKTLGFTNIRHESNAEDPTRAVTVCSLDGNEGTSLFYEDSQEDEEGAFTIGITVPDYYIGGLMVGADVDTVRESLTNLSYTLEDVTSFQNVIVHTYLAPSAAIISVQFIDGKCTAWSRSMD